MTTADDFENRTIGWWLQRLSLRQIWGLLIVIVALVGSAFSIGIATGRQSNADKIDSSQAEVVEPSDTASLPDGLTDFDVRVLRILAEPHENAVSPNYVAYRVKDSVRRVEGVYEKLEKMIQPSPTVFDRQIVVLIRTEGGDILSAVLLPRGVRYMDENKLFD